MKNTPQLKGDWNEIKGKLKQQFAEMSVNRIIVLDGSQEELLERIQQKLGQSKEEILKHIS
jgi:uncharacterized protein YjbJ (UPF0337 family)